MIQDMNHDASHTCRNASDRPIPRRVETPETTIVITTDSCNAMMNGANRTGNRT